MQTLEQAVPAKASHRPKAYLPREHGATAMLLTPIFSVAILARAWRWSELAVLAAAFAALSAKDPAVLLVRQRFVWKQKSVESSAAFQWLLGWSILLIAGVAILLATWPLKAFLAMGAGIAVFGCLAIVVNLKNRQRGGAHIHLACHVHIRDWVDCALVLVVLDFDCDAGERGNSRRPCPSRRADRPPQGRRRDPAFSSGGPGRTWIAPLCGGHSRGSETSLDRSGSPARHHGLGLRPGAAERFRIAPDAAQDRRTASSHALVRVFRSADRRPAVKGAVTCAHQSRGPAAFRDFARLLTRRNLDHHVDKWRRALEKHLMWYVRRDMNYVARLQFGARTVKN